MWDRYADEYREFAALDEIDSPLLLARQIVYQGEPPAISSAQNRAICR